MVRVLGSTFIAVALLSSIGAPAHGGADGAVVLSTETKIVVKDERGDQGRGEDSTRAERRAGDILRVRAWQDDRSGWVSLTYRGSIVAPKVQKWYASVSFRHRDMYEHPIIQVEIRRKRSYVRIFQTDGSQILCRRTPSLITNQGRTLATRIPRGCHWDRAHRLFAYTTVDRPRFQQMAVDAVEARCRLVWQ